MREYVNTFYIELVWRLSESAFLCDDFGRRTFYFRGGFNMKIAIIGSRNLHIENLEKYVPADASEIVSGGARGIDSCAEAYARANGLNFTVFLPEYDRFGRGAPIVRNKQIVDHVDKVLAFWDGKSRGTKSVIEYCKKQGKSVTVVIVG